MGSGNTLASGELAIPFDVGQQTAASLPKLLKAYSSNVLPFEQALFDASQKLQPQKFQQAIDLYTKFGPEANRIGADISKSNALSSAESELATLRGPGRQLFEEGLALDKLTNPEFYKTRETTNAALNSLIGSVNPNALTPTETAEIERNLAHSNLLPGTGSWQYAQTFGNALNSKKDRLAQILSLAPSTLQASKSSVDPFLIGVGRTGYGVQNNNNILPSFNPDLGNNVTQVGQNLFNQSANLANQNAQRQLQKNQNSDSWKRAQEAASIFQSAFSF